MNMLRKVRRWLTTSIAVLAINHSPANALESTAYYSCIESAVKSLHAQLTKAGVCSDDAGCRRKELIFWKGLNDGFEIGIYDTTSYSGAVPLLVGIVAEYHYRCRAATTVVKIYSQSKRESVRFTGLLNRKGPSALTIYLTGKYE
jgi:hypothetical protein